MIKVYRIREGATLNLRDHIDEYVTLPQLVTEAVNNVKQVNSGAENNF